MASIPKRLDRYLKQPYNKNDVIGFLSLYLIFVFLIPYLIFNYMSFEMFITYFANVDIIANVLSVNYPDYFIKWYSVYNDTLRGYLSFNIISVAALSGIFYFGIKDTKRSDTERLVIMITMSILTWTLPTLGIPYMNYKVEEYLINSQDINKTEYDKYRFLITISISLMFFLSEYFIISNIEKLKL